MAPTLRHPADARSFRCTRAACPGRVAPRRRWHSGTERQKFAVSLRTFPDRPELPILATAIQAKLKGLGIALDVKVGNSSEIPAGHQDGSLELGLYARNYALVPDALVTLADDFGADGADYGAMGWNNAILTSTLNTMASGSDPGALSRTDAAR